MGGPWNDHEKGLPTLDMLGEEFERNAAAHGEFMYDHQWYFNS